MIKLNGVSARINGCVGLIAKKSLTSYKKLSEYDKRWIDAEDILQEGLMAACEAESTFQEFKKEKPKFGPVPRNKFSTYLFTGLDFRLNRVLHTPLQQQKRDARRVTIYELDQPVNNESASTFADTITSDTDHPTRKMEVAESCLKVCSLLSPEAFLLFVEGFLLGSWTSAGTSQQKYQNLLQQIRKVCWNCEVCFSDLEFLIQNESARTLTLAKLSEMYIMGLGKDVQAEYSTRQAKLKILVCRECRGQFALDAIAEGDYFVSTYTCKSCYDTMAELPSSVTCFGKLKRIRKATGTVKQEGYSAKDIECQLHCPDRKICKQYANHLKEEVKQMPQAQSAKAQKAKMPPPSADEVEDIDVGDLDEAEETAAPAKKKSISLGKKAAPVAEEEEPETEEEVDDTEDEPEEDEDEAEEEEPEAEEAEDEPVVKTKAKKAAPVKAPVKAKKAAAKVEPKSVKGAKAVKAASPVKAAKTAAAPAKKAGKKAETELEDLYDAPKEIGGRWPHKKGSVMRLCFQRAYKGVKAADLQAEVEKNGRSWPIMLKVLRDGYAGKQRTTHRWKLEENGGRLKVVDVKPQFEVAE